MTRDTRPPEDQPPQQTRPAQDAGEDPQRAVARARAQVLAGRGPGAGQAEVARCTRERPTLGPFPAPLERELVHLHTAKVRSDAAGDVTATSVRNQVDRLREVWATPRTSVSSNHRKTLCPVCTAAVVAAAAAAAVLAVWLGRRSRRGRS